MRNRKKSYNRFTRRFIPVVIIAIMITLFVSITSVGAAEKKEKQTYINYMSVQIMPGDSLWSIANTYCDKSDMDVKAYIKELKELNNLSGDTIHSGNYLIVFYYTTN